VTDADLVAGAKAMEGDITQIPPMFSAIKVKGERLYKAARRGETVERKERQCTINSFEVWRDVSDPQLAHFRVDCSKGTYVRTLAFDLGKSLGTTAHLTELRRESIGEHSVQDAWTVESLFEACEPQVEQFLAAKEEAEKEAEK
jgi:tRNA pseudouridine55 synthase